MNRPGRTAVLGIAALLSGLLAGVYYAFAVGVLPGLDRLSDAAFADAMNNMNEAIVNPAFMLTFLGAPLLTLVAVFLVRRTGWVVAALVLNVAGLIVTAALNLPLNDALLADNNREAFEQSWITWNIVRMTLTAAACGCLIWAMAHRSTKS